MKEITELENRYIGIIKIEDFRDLDDKLKKDFRFIMSKIDEIRYKKGKPEMWRNKYLILNLEDEIDILTIKHIAVSFQLLSKSKVKVREIAVDLVNAILKAKENK